MLFISTRKNFWDSKSIPDYDEMKEVNLSDMTTGPGLDADWRIRGWENKRILILVHGYNNTAKNVQEAYCDIYNNCRDIVLKNDGTQIYDEIVGYVWPGEDNFLEFDKAVNLAEKSAERLRFWIEKIKSTANNVTLDVFTHSLGGRVILSTLKNLAHETQIDHVFTTAAAVNSDSMETNLEFFGANLKSKIFYVFHSIYDPVLRFAYQIDKGYHALGLTGPKDPAFVIGNQPNVKVVNCKNYITTHGGYKSCKPVFEYIRDEINSSYAKPRYVTL